MSTQAQRQGVIYYRVSTEEQAQFGISLTQQQQECARFAERQGIEIMQLFHDDGASAKTAERKGLQEMLQYCIKHAKELDCVVVYKIDRLSRNTLDYSTILVSLSKLNIKLLSATEAISDTPEGKFIGNIMDASAQFDNDVKSVRVSSCMRARFESGVWCWKAPVGYRNASARGAAQPIAVDEQRAPLVRLAFEKYATGLYSLEEVRRLVNKQGLRTDYGNEISMQTMSKIIRNTFYYGVMKSGSIEKEGTHTPLIDEQTYWQCQKRLNGNQRGDSVSKSRASEHFPLRHFVLCGLCNRPLTAYFAKGRHGGLFAYYRCYNKDCTSPSSIKQSVIEGAFTELLLNITPNEQYLTELKAALFELSSKE